MRAFNTSLLALLIVQITLLATLILASPLSKGGSGVEAVASKAELYKVYTGPNPTNPTKVNFANAGPVNAQGGAYCYRSGQVMNLDSASSAIPRCCDVLSNWYIPPNSYVFVSVPTKQANTVLLCQLSTHNKAWSVAYGDCMYAMTTVLNGCWKREGGGGSALSRGGEAQVPFGSNTLDARLDPNDG